MDTLQNCLNCKHSIQPDEKFCAKCGQKNSDGKVRFFQLTKDFVGDTFSLDSRLFKSIGPLFFKPGELTKQYFLGRHKSFVSPVRLFLFSIIFFFGMVALRMNTEDVVSMGENNGKEQYKRVTYYNDIIAKLDTAKQDFKTKVPNVTTHAVLDSSFKEYLAPKQMNDTTGLGILDADGNSIGLTVANEDLYTLSSEEILDKYEVEGFWYRILISKVIKISQDGQNFLKFLLSRMSWMIFLMMPIIAFSLKLLYVRRKKYYVEHFVFGIHYHSFAFLLMGILLIIAPYIHPAISSTFILILFVYLYMSMRRFYEQGRLKTFFKLTFLLFSYIFIFIFGFLALLSIGLLIY